MKTNFISTVVAVMFAFASTPLLAAPTVRPTMPKSTGVSAPSTTNDSFRDLSECTLEVEVELGPATVTLSATAPTCAEAATIIENGIKELKEVLKKVIPSGH